MPVSRRNFIKNSAVAAAAFVAAPLPAAWSGVHQASDNADPASHVVAKIGSLTRPEFEQAVGSAFQVSVSLPAGQSQAVWLRLLTVTDLPAIVPVNPASMAVPPPKIFNPVTTTGFMLTFSGSSSPLGQGVYAFQHEALGKFDLLIVPTGAGASTYTAVFNTLHPAFAAHLRPPQAFQPASGPGGGKPLKGSAGSSGLAAQEQVEPVFRDRVEAKLPE